MIGTLSEHKGLLGIGPMLLGIPDWYLALAIALVSPATAGICSTSSPVHKIRVSRKDFLARIVVQILTTCI